MFLVQILVRRYLFNDKSFGPILLDAVFADTDQLDLGEIVFSNLCVKKILCIGSQL
jgi:hypothetical protein